VQGIEIGDAVDAEHHGLTINDKMPGPVLQGGLDDPRITVSPVVPVACQQPDAIAITVNDQAKAVIFDFVNPLRTSRHLGAASRDGGLELHKQNIITPCRNATLSRDKHAVV
jgi:hypothetical protein